MNECWYESVPKSSRVIKTIAPICLDEWNASEVCIYPRSKLVSVDRRLLFLCRPMPRGVYPALSIGDMLAATTHIGLRRDEDGDPEIFLTACTDRSFSFHHNHTQPFGIWIDLIPVQTQSVLRLQRFGCRILQQKRLHALAWVAISHARLGSNASKWACELTSNADLMRMIIRTYFHH